MKAVLLISHGSRLPDTEEEVRAYVDQLRTLSDGAIMEYAFLEIAHPTIPEGIEICIDKGATEIVVLLNFLNAGKHVGEDIPRIVDEARAKHPEVKFHITKPIGQHDQIIHLFLDLINNSGQ